MLFYSTKKNAPKVDLKTAVLRGLAPDSGLYMPEKIHTCVSSFIDSLGDLSFQEIAYEVASTILQGSIDKDVLQKIVYETVDFPAPHVRLADNLYALELFHGPSLAFKDFGGRFMARLMAHFVKDSEETLHILVATSGDTGGAVAMGFLDVPGIEVTILYPSEKVSAYQEKQMTTLGRNIRAFEVKGVFDDCQAIVKQAFQDDELRSRINMTSANSINISRLIPQTFYYFWSYAQLKDKSKPVVMSVPSGNFGNITAGLMAKKMGLPIDKFIASVNANDVFTKYLNDGNFTAKDSIATISNAMDVGNPSNLSRIQDIYENSLSDLSKDVLSWSYSDEETINALKDLLGKYHYVSDPHGAVAYLGLEKFIKENPSYQGIFQITAHPSKFLDVVQGAIEREVEVPTRLKSLVDKDKQSTIINSDYSSFRNAFLKAINS